jgi:hypothetical protein
MQAHAGGCLEKIEELAQHGRGVGALQFPSEGVEHAAPGGWRGLLQQFQQQRLQGQIPHGTAQAVVAAEGVEQHALEQASLQGLMIAPGQPGLQLGSDLPPLAHQLVRAGRA